MICVCYLSILFQWGDWIHAVLYWGTCCWFQASCQSHWCKWECLQVKSTFEILQLRGVILLAPSLLHFCVNHVLYWFTIFFFFFWILFSDSRCSFLFAIFCKEGDWFKNYMKKKKKRRRSLKSTWPGFNGRVAGFHPHRNGAVAMNHRISWGLKYVLSGGGVSMLIGFLGLMSFLMISTGLWKFGDHS